MHRQRSEDDRASDQARSEDQRRTETHVSERVRSVSFFLSVSKAIIKFDN